MAMQARPASTPVLLTMMQAQTWDGHMPKESACSGLLLPTNVAQKSRGYSYIAGSGMHMHTLISGGRGWDATTSVALAGGRLRYMHGTTTRSAASWKEGPGQGIGFRECLIRQCL